MPFLDYLAEAKRTVERGLWIMARILLVNDESDLVNICEMVLEEAGYEVDTLTDGRKALELARRTRPDLVILDWVMKKPEGPEGEDVLRQLRTDAATARIPVLMVSAIVDGEITARTYGTEGFLKKPFTAEALLSGVQELLQAARH
jgi:DNA-binding response OmpR family regulator